MSNNSLLRKKAVDVAGMERVLTRHGWTERILERSGGFTYAKPGEGTITISPSGWDHVGADGVEVDFGGNESDLNDYMAKLESHPEHGFYRPDKFKTFDKPGDPVPEFDEVHYIHYPEDNTFNVVLFNNGRGVYSRVTPDAEIDAVVGQSTSAKMRAGDGIEVRHPNMTGEEVPFKSLTVLPSSDLTEDEKKQFGMRSSLRKRVLAAYMNGYAEHAAAYLRQHGNTPRYANGWANKNGLKPDYFKEAIITMSQYASAKRAVPLSTSENPNAACPKCRRPIGKGEMINWTADGTEAHIVCPPRGMLASIKAASEVCSLLRDVSLIGKKAFEGRSGVGNVPWYDDEQKHQRHGFFIPMNSAPHAAHHLAEAGLTDFDVETDEKLGESFFSFADNAELETAHELIRQVFETQIESGEGHWADWKQLEQRDAMTKGQNRLMSSAEKTAGAWGVRSFDNDSVHDILDKYRSKVTDGGKGFDEPIPNENLPALFADVDAMLDNVATADDIASYFGTMVFLVRHGTQLDREHKNTALIAGRELLADPKYLNLWNNPASRKAQIDQELTLFGGKSTTTAAITNESARRAKFEQGVKTVGLDSGPWMRRWDSATPEDRNEMWTKISDDIHQDKYRRSKYEKWCAFLGFDVAERLAEWDAVNLTKRDVLYEGLRGLLREKRKNK